MFKRLSGPTGEISDTANTRADDTPDKIVRSAILVHSGPNGKATTHEGSVGDVTLDEKLIERLITNHNAMIGKLAVQYGGFEKMPIGAYPPILDQHADDSNDRIRGRLSGLLRFEKRSVPKVGDNVACAISDITFLGRDAVSQVLDGRIYHLSVGIDEDAGILGEVSTVIEPAALGAMVLSKKKLASLRPGMTVVYRGQKVKVCPSSDANEQYVYVEVPGEGRKLVKTENVKVLSKKTNEVSKMSKKNLAELAALGEEIKGLTKKATEHKQLAKLAKRKLAVQNHFTKLMADKKMTPAEFKKVDITRLAKLDKASFDDVMHVYDVREPQVMSGQQGTTSAAVFSDVGTKTTEDREVKRLKAAVKKSMSKQGFKFLAADDEEKELSAEEKMDAKLETEKSDDKKLDGSDEGQAGGEVQEREEMMQQIEENAAQIARVASMVEGIITEMKGDSDASEENDGEKSELADDDKKDDEDKKDLDKKDENEKDKKEEGAE